MIKPEAMDGTIFEYEEDLYTFNYDAEEDVMSFCNSVTGEDVTEQEDCKQLLLVLVRLGKTALLQK